jgi:SAM-dependent MidA family methyltransferase
LEIEQLALPEDYCSEINIHSREWLVTIAERLRVGVILLIDYGYSRHDYYHPQRSDGTLQCHYQHRAHPNPLIYPGIQDITAHVDFTAIADTALAAGLRVHGYANQANFLLGCDITGYLKQQLESHGEEMAQQLELTNQLKKLTMPGEMGESFKVIALSRAIEIPLLGFALRDDRHRL